MRRYDRCSNGTAGCCAGYRAPRRRRSGWRHAAFASTRIACGSGRQRGRADLGGAPGERVTRIPDFLARCSRKTAAAWRGSTDSLSTMTPDRRCGLGRRRRQRAVEQTRELPRSLPFRRTRTGASRIICSFVALRIPWMVTTHISAGPRGVAPPAAGWFWETLFDRGGSRGRRRRAPGVMGVFGPAGVAGPEHTRVAAKERRDRFEMVRFAQTVFGESSTGMRRWSRWRVSAVSGAAAAARSHGDQVAQRLRARLKRRAGSTSSRPANASTPSWHSRRRWSRSWKGRGRRTPSTSRPRGD